MCQSSVRYDVFMHAGIYARISLDRDDTQLGVQRQLQDCTAEAKRRGWTVVDNYVDNDVSATRASSRPEYERLIQDIKNKRIGAFIVWDLDRLTRTPRELEDIIELAEKYGVKLANIGGDIDLSTPQGMMTARIKGTVARHESDQHSRRLRRSIEQRAAAGAPHGQIPYGFEREDYVTKDGVKSRRDVPHPVNAPIVVDLAERVLAGESLRSIVTSLNDRGIPSPKGKQWTSMQLKQVLRRPSAAGLQVLRGEIVGKSNSIPLYDEGTYYRLKALFDDPSRVTGIGSRSSHLLSSIARCGLCGGKMRRIPGRFQYMKRTGSTKRQPSLYSCNTCFKIGRKQSLVDAVVEGAVIGRLKQPDLISALAAGRPEEVMKARTEVADLEARLSLAADQFADGDITGAQMKRITQRLKPKISELQQKIATAEPKPGVAHLAGADAEARWEAASIDIKRSVVDMLMTVTILPTGPGRGDKPEAIQIEWKGSE